MKLIYIKNLEELKLELIDLMKDNQHVTFINPPYSIFYLGVVYIRTMLGEAKKFYPNTELNFICDCSNNAALAHEALKMKFKIVKFSGNKIMREKLISIANQVGSKVIK